MKRVFDLTLACWLALFVMPILGVLYVIVVYQDGHPFLYRSIRNKTVRRKFKLLKIRTMRSVPKHENLGVTGGHKSNRITPLGRKMRKTRLDELPQIINVLRGDISFVGPRPPEPRYVRACPEIYKEVLRDKPGITGLASIIFHRHEEKMLAQCESREETEAVYIRRSVPRKARLDKIYHDNQSLGLDLYIIYLTAAKLVPLPGRRAKRVRKY